MLEHYGCTIDECSWSAGRMNEQARIDKIEVACSIPYVVLRSIEAPAGLELRTLQTHRVCKHTSSQISMLIASPAYRQPCSENQLQARLHKVGSGFRASIVRCMLGAVMLAGRHGSCCCLTPCRSRRQKMMHCCILQRFQLRCLTEHKCPTRGPCWQPLAA